MAGYAEQPVPVRAVLQEPAAFGLRRAELAALLAQALERLAQLVGERALPRLDAAYARERQPQAAKALYLQERLQVSLGVVPVPVRQPEGLEEPFGLVIAYAGARQAAEFLCSSYRLHPYNKV